jgi:hypothetical protein
LFKNAGGGHLDLMTCEVVFERLGAKLNAADISKSWRE